MSGYGEFEQPSGSASTTLVTGIDLGFTAQDWAGGNYIEIIRAGVPNLRQIGPHKLDLYTYDVGVYEYLDASNLRRVEVGIIINRAIGLITLFKSSRVPAFSGRVIVERANV